MTLTPRVRLLVEAGLERMRQSLNAVERDRSYFQERADELVGDIAQVKQEIKEVEDFLKGFEE